MSSSSARLSGWQRAKHLGLVAILALAFALTLGIFVESTYARPDCVAYGSSRQLTYGGLGYPSAPIGIPNRQVPTCLFMSAERTVTAVPYAEVAPSRWVALLVDLATTPVLTVPLLFGLLTAGLFGMYGVLGMTAPPAGTASRRS